MKPNEKRDCKIVRDLLPNYIEKLTDEVTNEFIEEHISKCEECRKVLHDMNGEVEIEEFNQDEEIKYLKRLNTKVKMIIAIISLIVIIIASCIVIIIASCVIIYINNKSKMQVNNYTFLKAEYVREDKEKTIDGNVYGTLIAVIEPNGKCKSVRVVEKGYTESRIGEQYEVMNEFLYKHTNVSIINDELHYNTNEWNGLYKKDVKNNWKEKYVTITNVEEI